MKERQIIILGYKVDVVTYDYGAFYYPSFNGNAEFKVSADGFRRLSSYLRSITYLSKLL